MSTSPATATELSAQSTAPVVPSPKPGPNSPIARQPPPGYKFVKVAKADGTIVTVKKKLTPEELASIAAAPSTASKEARPPKPVQDAEQESVEYKIITVKKPDGTLGKVRRPVRQAGTVDSAAGPSSLPKEDSTPTSAEKSAGSKTDTASKAGAATISSDSSATAAGTAELSQDEREALRAQDVYHKQRRRQQFKTTLFNGLVRSMASTTIEIPELSDGDEILSDDDISVDDDDDDFGDQHSNTMHAVDNSSSRDADDNDDDSSPKITINAGTAASGLANSMAAPPVRPPPYHAPPTGATGNGADKDTYKVTNRDLKQLDEKAEKGDLDRPLNRHWADFSFYFMASLSVILPLLFLILTIFIILMKGKSVDSAWGKIEDPIKIAISAWPIVFAAVVAQAFKTWATFRVERGIKLMELEQLVGSNSFGSAMKQPFLLRRLDVLTLVIFLVWCLSPIGSQALQRVYFLERGSAADTISAYYVGLKGQNRLLSPSSFNTTSDISRSDLTQLAAVYYMGSFLPSSVASYQGKYPLTQDQYTHPYLNIKHRTPGFSLTTTEILSAYGIPVALPRPVVELQSTEEEQKVGEQAMQRFENVQFPVVTSYFNFTCGQWRSQKRAQLDQIMYFSLSETLGLNFTGPNDTSITIDRISFATLTGGTNSTTGRTSNVTIDENWDYSVIDCSFKQVFVNTSVYCEVDTMGGTYMYSCLAAEFTVMDDKAVDPSWHTPLVDFSLDFVLGGSPFSLGNPTTPTERYAELYLPMDGTFYVPGNLSTLSELATPDRFASAWGYLFNTYVSAAHCPECISVTSDSYITDTLRSNNPAVAALFDEVKEVQHKFSEGVIFATDWRWIAVLLTCTIILLVVGAVSVAVESMLVAPDVLGYVSTVARNSRYLHLPKTAGSGGSAGPVAGKSDGPRETTGAMGGAERARRLGGLEVMMQDVKAGAQVGKIALGLKHSGAERLKPGRLYR